jgi:hypothetical protein
MSAIFGAIITQRFAYRGGVLALLMCSTYLSPAPYKYFLVKKLLRLSLDLETSRLLCRVYFLEQGHGKEKEKENNQTETGAPAIADAAAAELAP